MQKLRISLSSSSTTSNSQDEGVELEQTCGFEIGCGSCKSKRCSAPFCQIFATTRWALLFFGLGAFTQGFLVNGHTPAVITTLERRFELSSTEAGLIASCYDFAGTFAILFVTYIGGNGHKPLWIGWGMVMIGLGGIFFTLPHYIAPTYTFTNVLNLCGNAAAETCSISAVKNFRFVFYGAMLLVGAGTSPIFSLGITFLDENVKQRYSSLYNGILILFSIVGPGLGFLAGGALLSYYTYPQESVSINESSEDWIGAWWIGPLISGIIGLLAAVPVLMLPRVIPGTEQHRIGRGQEMHSSAREDGEDENFGKRFSDFPKCVLILFRNPTFVFESFAIALDSLLIGGMAVFGAKFMEILFGLDAGSAGTYFVFQVLSGHDPEPLNGRGSLGILVILGGAGGQLVGGWLISKYDIKVRRLLHICYIAPLICVFASLGNLLTCSETVFAGVTVPYTYPSPADNVNLISMCNSGCNCSSGVFRPVCGSDGVTYFSPCFAGCSEKLNDMTYSGCSCVPPSESSATATRGACLDDTCSSGWQIILFCLSTLVLLFFTFLNEAPALQVTLRCVAFNRRSFAIGVQILIFRAFGTFPGPLVVGAIFDHNCLHWTEECGTRGSCLAYDSANLSLHIFLFLAIGKLLDVILFLGGLFTYKPLDAAASSQPNRDKQLESKVGVISSDVIVKTEQPRTLSRNYFTLPGETGMESSFSNPLYEE